MVVYKSLLDVANACGKRKPISHDLLRWGTIITAGTVISPYIGVALLEARLIRGPAVETFSHSKSSLTRATGRVGVDGSVNYHTSFEYPELENRRSQYGDFALFALLPLGYAASEGISKLISGTLPEDSSFKEAVFQNIFPVADGIARYLTSIAS